MANVKAHNKPIGKEMKYVNCERKTKNTCLYNYVQPKRLKIASLSTESIQAYSRKPLHKLNKIIYHSSERNNNHDWWKKNN